jgi:hypothetical protein
MPDITDSRGAPRRGGRAKGVVYVGSLGIFCEILDLSRSGCRISCPRASEIPDAFELHFVGQPNLRPVQVVWRKNDQIGVTFPDAAGPTGTVEI